MLSMGLKVYVLKFVLSVNLVTRGALSSCNLKVSWKTLLPNVNMLEYNINSIYVKVDHKFL